MQALRILFLSLEFRAGTFSGNGIYATAQVPVSSWFRLDAGSPWREFAAGVLDGAVGEEVRAFAPHVVMAVDWSALQAVRNLAPYCGGAPYVYLNYRVFTRTTVGEDLELIRSMEAAAMAEALLTLALSRSDAEFLVSQVAGRAGVCAQQQQTQAQGSHPPLAAAAPPARPKVLLPALREDVRQLAPPADLLPPESAGSVQEADRAAAAAVVVAASRPYLSCLVRLSPEKEPKRFVELVESMAAQGLLARHQLTPLMMGVGSDEYATGLKSRLRIAAPDSVILERFIGPQDLAEIYSRTRLNFHPPMYDAYGMTIVEAASQGAPSVVHDGDGAVGATDLLRASEGEVFLLDLAAPAAQLAAQLGAILEDPAALAAASLRALHRARSWDEAANVSELVRLVREALPQPGVGGRPSSTAIAAE